MVERVLGLTRSALPASLKASLAEVLCAPWVGRAIGQAFGDRIPCRGLRVDTHFDFVADRTKAEIFWGIYESAEARFAQKHLRTDLDVVELGSSLGVVSSQIRRMLTPRARLVCVEANPTLLPALRANLERNAGGLPVSVLNFAIDYGERGTVALHVGSNTAASHTVGDAARATSTVDVPTTRLRDILASERVERYVLVSDIEGAEAGILFEDADALTRCEQILIELHDTDHRGRRHTWQELSGAFQGLGFRLRDQHGPVCVLSR
jgi:FkbM family methyltransferase